MAGELGLQPHLEKGKGPLPLLGLCEVRTDRRARDDSLLFPVPLSLSQHSPYTCANPWELPWPWDSQSLGAWQG